MRAKSQINYPTEWSGNLKGKYKHMTIVPCTAGQELHIQVKRGYYTQEIYDAGAKAIQRSSSYSPEMLPWFCGSASWRRVGTQGKKKVILIWTTYKNTVLIVVDEVARGWMVGRV